MINNILIFLDTKNLKILSKNMFTKNTEDEHYLLQNKEQILCLLLLNNDIELLYVIENSQIYEGVLNDQEIDNILDTHNYKAITHIKRINISLHIATEIMKLIFKLSIITNYIIIQFYQNNVVIKYKKQNDIYTIENIALIKIQNYSFMEHKIENTIIMNVVINDFIAIISAHQCIHNYKSITGNNPQTQILIEPQRIKILSTNYTIGLINYIQQTTEERQIHGQLQIGKTIEINKIKTIFEFANKVEIISYKKNTYDAFNRMKSKFIRITNKNNYIYIRLYESEINLFNEDILDDQLTLAYRFQGDNILDDIQTYITDITDIKILEIVNIQYKAININQKINYQTNIVYKSQDKSITVNSSKYRTLETEHKTINIQLPGHTIHMINNIVKHYKLQETTQISVSLSQTGVQGKIEIEHKFKTNIIFV